MGKKTLWEKIYSFFGFWKYTSITDTGKYRIYYWCCFPWKFYRKFDIFRIKVK